MYERSVQVKYPNDYTVIVAFRIWLSSDYPQISSQYHFPIPASALTLMNPLGASVSMRTWLQESSTKRSAMNLTGVEFTSCRLTHTSSNE